MSRKNIIDRVLNRPSESRGSQPSGLLLVLFVEAKRIKPFPFGNFLLVRKFPKGHGFILFASAKRTKKQTGLRPATSVQIAGRCGVFGKMTSAHQVTGYVRAAILHSIDGNDLNRCELQALHKRICGFVRTRSGFF